MYAEICGDWSGAGFQEIRSTGEIAEAADLAALDAVRVSAIGKKGRISELMAQLGKLPVIFVCENNLFAMGTPIAVHTAVQEIYRKACAFDMTSERVDGNEVRFVRADCDEEPRDVLRSIEVAEARCVEAERDGRSRQHPCTLAGSLSMLDTDTQAMARAQPTSGLLVLVLLAATMLI